MSGATVRFETEGLGAKGDDSAGRRWRGLLWRESLAHGPLLWRYVGAWLIGQIVLMLFFQPGIVLAFGILCALYFGSEFGGSDARDGALEFTLALPATRAELFLVRFAYAGAVLAALMIGSVVAFRYGIAQTLWGLVVETGFTKPFPPTSNTLLAAILIVPLATLAMTFVIASIATDAKAVGAAATSGFLMTVVIALAGWGAEWYLVESSTGKWSIAFLAVAAVICLVLGFGAARVREGVARPDAAGSGASARSGVGFAILSLFVLMVVLGILAVYLLSARPS